MGAAELFLDAFDAVGVDPELARGAARNYGSTSSWTASQAAQTALVGAGALAVPGVHILGLGVDLTMVLHKMAWTSWGVGELLGAEVDGKLDLALILGIWSGAVTEDMLAGAVNAALAGIVVHGTLVTGTPVFVSQLASKIIGVAATSVLLDLGVPKKGAKLLGKAAPFLVKKIMAKVAPKAAAVMAGGTAGKAIPLIGAVVGAGVNAWIITSISRAAQQYYHAKARVAR